MARGSGEGLSSAGKLVMVKCSAGEEDAGTLSQCKQVNKSATPRRCRAGKVRRVALETGEQICNVVNVNRNPW